MSTDALFMPPTPRLRNDMELPPCPDLVDHLQNVALPFVGGWSSSVHPSVHQVSQASSTAGTASLLVPKAVRFVDTAQYAAHWPISAGDAHVTHAHGAVEPIVPRTSGAPQGRVSHSSHTYNRVPQTRSPHNRIPHNVLDGGVGARGDRYTHSDSNYQPVVPDTVRRYGRPAGDFDRSTGVPPSSYALFSYGPEEDPFPKVSVWRRVARKLFCCV